MATTIKLPDELIADARRYGKVYSRSAPKQIEFWVKIGKIAEDNPDMPYEKVCLLNFRHQFLENRTKAPLQSLFQKITC